MSAPEVTLRPLEPGDAMMIAAWADDPVFLAGADWGRRRPAETVEFWRSLILRPPADLVRLGAEETGRLVGYVDLHGTNPTRRELGYAVGPSQCWGRGLGAALARAGLVHGFDRLGLSEVHAEANAANRPSVRILQRLGMRDVGKGGAADVLGGPTYLRRFAITRDEWVSRPVG